MADSVNIPISLDRSSAQRTLKELEKITKAKIDLDTKDALKDLDKLTDKDIDVEANISGLQDLKSLQSEVEDLKDKNLKIDADLGNSISEVSKLEKELESLETSSNSVFDTLVGGFAGGLGAGLIIEGLGSIASIGGGTEKALAQLQATTGLTREEAEKLNDTAKDLFATGVGENVEEVRQSLGTARKEFSAFLEPAEIDAFVKSAGGIAQVFDKDINEVVQLSRTFVQNFGLEGEEAGDLIAFGLQNAGNQADDFLDTVSEYSPVVKEAGFEAEEFVSILSTGVQAGARDTDKFADAIKEAGLIIRAGDFSNAFKGLSEGANEAEKATINSINAILQSAQKGDISIAEALTLSTQEVNNAVDAKEIGDSFAQQLQVAFAGTQAEEVGIEFFNKAFSTPIDPQNIKERGKEASQAISEAIQPQGFEGLQRTITLLAGELANTLLPAIQPIIDVLQQDLLPIIQEVLGNVSPILKQILGAVSPIIKQLSGFLLPLIESASKVIEPLLNLLVDIVESAFKPLLLALEPIFEVLTPINELLGSLLSIVTPIIGVIIKFAAEILALSIKFNPLLIVLRDFLIPQLEKFVEFIDKNIVPAIEAFANTAGEVISRLGSLLGLTEETTEAQKEQNKELEKANKENEKNVETLEERNKRLEEAKSKTEQSTLAIASETKAKEDNTTATEKLKKRIGELNKLIENAIFKGAIEEAKNYQTELDNVNSQLFELEKSLKEFARIGLDLTLNTSLDANAGEKELKAYLDGLNNTLKENKIEPQTNFEDLDSQIQQIESAFDRTELFGINLGFDAGGVGEIDTFISDIGESLANLPERIFEKEFFEDAKEGFEDLADSIGEYSEKFGINIENLEELGIKSTSSLADAFSKSFETIGFLTDDKKQSFDDYAEGVANASGALASSLEEGTQLQKAAAITEAIINSYLAFTQVIKDPKLPTLAKIPLAGVILAAGLLQVNKIRGAETGVVGIDENYKGKVGKSDTIPVMVAKGESVISASGTAKNFEALQLANKGIDIKEHYSNNINLDLNPVVSGLSRIERKINKQTVNIVNKSSLKLASWR